MTGEIPFYGLTGNQLWRLLGQAISEWGEANGVRLDVGPGGSGWTGVSFGGRGRVLQVRINAASLRCYPLGVEPRERFQALDHEPSKCSKSWKKRFPSMFTVDAPEQVPLALELCSHVFRRVALEEPVPAAPPMLVVTPSS